jgi:hypothetical protein
MLGLNIDTEFSTKLTLFGRQFTIIDFTNIAKLGNHNWQRTGIDSNPQEFEWTVSMFNNVFVNIPFQSSSANNCEYSVGRYDCKFLNADISDEDFEDLDEDDFEGSSGDDVDPNEGVSDVESSKQDRKTSRDNAKNKIKDKIKLWGEILGGFEISKQFTAGPVPIQGTIEFALGTGIEAFAGSLYEDVSGKTTVGVEFGVGPVVNATVGARGCVGNEDIFCVGVGVELTLIEVKITPLFAPIVEILTNSARNCIRAIRSDLIAEVILTIEQLKGRIYVYAEGFLPWMQEEYDVVDWEGFKDKIPLFTFNGVSLEGQSNEEDINGEIPTSNACITDDSAEGTSTLLESPSEIMGMRNNWELWGSKKDQLSSSKSTYQPPSWSNITVLTITHSGGLPNPDADYRNYLVVSQMMPDGTRSQLDVDGTISRQRYLDGEAFIRIHRYFDRTEYGYDYGTCDRAGGTWNSDTLGCSYVTQELSRYEQKYSCPSSIHSYLERHYLLTLEERALLDGFGSSWLEHMCLGQHTWACTPYQEELMANVDLVALNAKLENSVYREWPWWTGDAYYFWYWFDRRNSDGYDINFRWIHAAMHVNRCNWRPYVRTADACEGDRSFGLVPHRKKSDKYIIFHGNHSVGDDNPIYAVESIRNSRDSGITAMVHWRSLRFGDLIRPEDAQKFIEFFYTWSWLESLRAQ